MHVKDNARQWRISSVRHLRKILFFQNSVCLNSSRRVLEEAIISTCCRNGYSRKFVEMARLDMGAQIAGQTGRLSEMNKIAVFYGNFKTITSIDLLLNSIFFLLESQLWNRLNPASRLSLIALAAIESVRVMRTTFTACKQRRAWNWQNMFAVIPISS